MPIRKRILLTLLTFSIASIVIFGGAVMFSTEHLEYSVIEATYKSELRHIKEQIARQESKNLPNSSQVKAFWGLSGSVPTDFIQYGRGSHHDIKHEGHYYHLYVQPLNGDLLYVAINIDSVEVFEETLATVMLIIAVAMIATTVWISWMLTQYVLRPVTVLAEDIEQLEPGRRSLPERQYDPDLAAIEHSINQYLSRIDDHLIQEKQFSGMASHELRTPVATIASTVETLLNQLPADQLESATHERLKRLQRASKDVRYISESLLSLVKDRKLDIGEICYLLSKPLGELVEDYRDFLLRSDSGLEFEVQTDIETRIDSELVRIIIGNLLRNALQHGRSVVVRLTIDSPHLIVSDDGDGLADNIQIWLNDPEHHSVPDKDIGLGLYIVRVLITRLGWGLEVVSSEKLGTRFTINTNLQTGHRFIGPSV